MNARAVQAELKDIQSLRALFLQETNFQVRYNAYHERGWTDSYVLTVDDLEVGHGSIKGQNTRRRDTVLEFFVIHPFRKLSSALFSELITISGVKYIECQSNDILLSSMLYHFSRSVSADVVLFQDHTVTEHAVPGAVVRRRRDDDRIFEHRVEPVGDYVLALMGEVVATGGFMLHYNMPFADLYIEVRQDCRGRGLGSFLLQELKKECYLGGRVPAARCEIQNVASSATLIKAGLRACGFMLKGKIKPGARRLTRNSEVPPS